jgi:CheY-like chemotaxis protein
MFDLILMDYEMPLMGGLEATKEIRKYESNFSDKHIPIIALSAHVISTIKDQCIEAGMDDFVSKPIDAKELSAVIIKILKLNS